MPEVIDGLKGCNGLCICFAVHNQKANGFLKSISTTSRIFITQDWFPKMAKVIEDMVDDGSWAIAQVEILNRAA